MAYNYRKLLGRIVEKFSTQARFLGSSHSWEAGAQLQLQRQRERQQRLQHEFRPGGLMVSQIE